MSPYTPVEPREHSPECRYRHRPTDPAERPWSHGGGGFDVERCERCRNLDARLDYAALKRTARAKLDEMEGQR